MYGELNNVIRDVKGNDNLRGMGKWNAVVEEGGEGVVVGSFDLGEKNERGDRLVDFCTCNQPVMTIAWFQHHAREDIHGRQRET